MKKNMVNNRYFFLAGLLLVAYIFILIISNNYNQREVEKYQKKEVQTYIKKNAVSIEYFFNRLKADISSLSENKQLTSYFLNKDLGMSLKYGLKTNLKIMNKLLNNFILNHDIQGTKIFKEIVVLDSNNKIISSTNIKSNEMFESLNLINSNSSKIIIEKYKNNINTFIYKSIFFKNKIVGTIIAQLNINETLDKLLIDKNKFILFSDIGSMNSELTKNELSDNSKYASIELSNTPFILYGDIKQRNEESLYSKVFIIGISLLAFPVLGIIYYLILLNNKNINLNKEQKTLLLTNKKEKELKDELENIFDNAQVGLLCISKERIIEKANNEASHILGYESSEEIVGLNTREFYTSEEEYIEYGKKSFQAMKIGNTQKVEYELRKKDGSLTWCEVEAKAMNTDIPINFEKGILLVFTDISERKKHLDEIRSQKEKLNEVTNRFELTLDAVEDGIWDWNIKTDYLYFSKNWALMLGYKKEELANNSESFFNLIHEKDKLIIQNKLELHFKDPINNKFSISIRLKCKDGSYKWIRSRGKVLLDENKNPIRMLGYHNDITLEKQYQDELKEQKEEFETIFNYSQDGITVTDLEGNFLKSNIGFLKLTGFSIEEILTKSCDDLTIPADRGINKKVIEKVISENSVEHIEKNCIFKDGKIVMVSMAVSLLPDKKRLLLLIHDNTALKIMQEQSKLASMGEMIGNIAHQWRQPLSVISTAATGTKIEQEMDILDDKDLIRNMDIINDSAQYLSSTIDDFRNFLNPKNNNTNKFLISDLIIKTLNLMKTQFFSNEIEIIKSIENISIVSVENELMQVLVNILNNSIDALLKIENQKRYIFINVYKKENHLVIEIKDNAKGIPKKIIDRIFEPYFTTKHQSQGTGIGLYMSKQIIKNHLGGKILVSNKKYTYNGINYIGALFTIEIPLS